MKRLLIASALGAVISLPAPANAVMANPGAKPRDDNRSREDRPRDRDDKPRDDSRAKEDRPRDDKPVAVKEDKKPRDVIDRLFGDRPSRSRDNGDRPSRPDNNNNSGDRPPRPDNDRPNNNGGIPGGRPPRPDDNSRPPRDRDNDGNGRPSRPGNNGGYRPPVNTGPFPPRNGGPVLPPGGPRPGRDDHYYDYRNNNWNDHRVRDHDWDRYDRRWDYSPRRTVIINRNVYIPTYIPDPIYIEPRDPYLDELEVIARQIKTALDRDPELRYCKLDTDTVGYSIELEGYVDNVDQLQRVIDVSRDIDKDVRIVITRVRIR